MEGDSRVGALSGYSSIRKADTQSCKWDKWSFPVCRETSIRLASCASVLLHILPSLSFGDGTHELSKRPVLLAFFKMRHFVKLRLLLELQVVLKMCRVQFTLHDGALNGAARLAGVRAVDEAKRQFGEYA